MAINKQPIWIGKPDNQWGAGAITGANTAMDGTGTVTTVYTASSDGGYVVKVVFKASGTNAATVARIWLNNGSTNSTAANNSLLDELTLPATTASNSIATQKYEVVLNLHVKAGYKLNVTLGTAVSAGWHVTVVGGDYTA